MSDKKDHAALFAKYEDLRISSSLEIINSNTDVCRLKRQLESSEEETAVWKRREGVASEKADASAGLLVGLLEGLLQQTGRQYLASIGKTIADTEDWVTKLESSLSGYTVQQLYMVWTKVLFDPFLLPYASMDGGSSSKVVGRAGCMLMHSDRTPLLFKSSGLWARMSRIATQQIIKAMQQGGK